MRREIQLIGETYVDPPATSQESINWIPEAAEVEGARSPLMLRGLPGLIAFNSDAELEPGEDVSTLRIYGDAYGGEVGEVYEYTYSAFGGVAPYSWRILSGNLPPGLAFDGDTGILSGTFTKAGSYGVLIEVADSAGGIATSYDAITVTEAVGPAPPLTPSVLTNPSFESGNTGWTVDAAYRAFSGLPAVSPGFVITNTPGRTGSWLMRWQGDPQGSSDRCYNATVANTYPGAIYTASVWVRCNTFSRPLETTVQAGILLEKFEDAALTIPSGSTVSQWANFNGVNTTWQELQTIISSGGYIRASLIITQGVNVTVTAQIDFDDVSWNVQEIA